MMRDKSYSSKLFISIALFLVSGILSTWLYHNLQGKGGIYYPGLIYTTTTVVIFLLTKTPFEIKNLTIYYFFMIVTYLVIWLLTMLSSWFAAIFGILTAGGGAIITFMLTDRFIKKIKYNRVHLLIIGGLAFVITDILYFIFSNTFGKTPVEHVFKVDNPPATLFLEVFVFWHVLVGTKLFLTLSKSRK